MNSNFTEDCKGGCVLCSVGNYTFHRMDKFTHSGKSVHVPRNLHILRNALHNLGIDQVTRLPPRGPSLRELPKTLSANTRPH